MAHQSINLSNDLVKKARRYGGVHHRSAPKQIEYWASIGQIAEENPDLPYEFIKELLLAQTEESIPFDLSELN